MTYFPEYFKSYPNMHTSYPLSLSLHRLEHGFRAHRHDFLEFSYVISGSGWETINEVKHAMVPGTFTFVLPYQVHELFTDPGSELVLFNCMFSMDLLMESGQNDGLAGLIEMSPLPAFTQFEGKHKDRIQYLLEDMLEEYNGIDSWRKTILQLRLKEILICFDRYRRHATSSPILSSTTTSTKHATVWPIIHHIHCNYQEDLTLSKLASQFDMSVSRISEVIKLTTGQTYVHFLHDLRLRHACSLLVSTDMSMVEIALEVGYGSYKTFSRIFRKNKGVVPKDYRKSITYS
ncbi:AraC family transcriptional regulator [Paenibacillus baekrokdamisoli]|uniref:AraC family transcriptional regulator n=1 Tax=Paenibacillus baekrokdamisoli TaxID=1712516 RepID=A0A3G9JDU6_9BACL|nr:AraC family transcriptional regulator [Paenibacillus baekrokdamisoli]MBB3070360.1 AraC-like DNA-binding protein [Paenibacillus baekrokdamisoli]BBH21364.1 AraC family transcriptional regulator [Paenibacillus baekrokdamisoli]